MPGATRTRRPLEESFCIGLTSGVSPSAAPTARGALLRSRTLAVMTSWSRVGRDQVLAPARWSDRVEPAATDASPHRLGRGLVSAGILGDGQKRRRFVGL